MNDSTKKSELESSSNNTGSFALNRNKLKYIAITAMLLDHIGMVFSGYFFQSTPATIIYTIFRFLGRLTAPIMCYFLAQGFIHTHSKKQYALRLAIFALISQVPYALAHKHSILSLDFNMLFVLFISFIMLCIWETRLAPFPKFLLLLLLLAASAFCDWGLVGPLFVLFFYLFRENRRNMIISYCILILVVCLMGIIFYREYWHLGLFLFIPVLFLYNGEPGSRAAFHKWFFYLFYPVHLLVLWLIFILL